MPMTSRVENWQTINFNSMVFPAIMQVDYVRVYQRDGEKNIGCDPKAYPTADYINRNLVNYQSELCSAFVCEPQADRHDSRCELVYMGGVLA